MFWCSSCQRETDGETCPVCGKQPEIVPGTGEDGRSEAKWNFGFSQDKDEPKWPDGPDGKPEKAVFLVHTGDFGSAGEMTEAMIRSFGIPVISNFPGDGSLGRVVLGFSGYGRELYVPESRLELARELLRAPNAEPEDADEAGE